jgi:large subunit ribosomal protein L25
MGPETTMTATLTKKHVPELTVSPRPTLGSHANAALRADGRLPAQIYGGKDAAGKRGGNEPLSLNFHELELCLRHKPTLVILHIEGKGDQPALLKEIQYGPMSRDVIHIDFQRVKLDEMVDVAVPLDFIGTPQGSDQGVRLEVQHSSLHVRVRADSIPESIPVPVGELKLHDKLTAADIKLPVGSTLLGKPHSNICMATKARKVVVVEATPASDAAAGAVTPAAGGKAGAAAPAAGKAGDAKGGDAKGGDKAAGKGDKKK